MHGELESRAGGQGLGICYQNQVENKRLLICELLSTFALTDAHDNPGNEASEFLIPIFQLRNLRPGERRALPKVTQLLNGRKLELGPLSLGSAPCLGWT